MGLFDLIGIGWALVMSHGGHGLCHMTDRGWVWAMSYKGHELLLMITWHVITWNVSWACVVDM